MRLPLPAAKRSARRSARSGRPRLALLAIGEGLILLLSMLPVGLAHAATRKCFGMEATIVGTSRPEVIQALPAQM